MILLDSANSVDQYVDTDVIGGSWYYYTLFIQDTDDTWNRAGATSGIAVKKPWVRGINQIVGPQYDTQTVPFGFSDLMWERIPDYFKYVRRDNAAVTDDYFLTPSTQAFLTNPDEYDVENQDLRSFLDILGWGLDYVHNYEETILNANDPTRAHLQNVNRLADEFGIDFEYAIPATVMRSKVANAALLARRRGTLQGLADVAALSTGWDVDIQVNQNLFLNRDQSEFANPIYPGWDAGVNYANGQSVQYESRIFTAIPVQPPVITLGTTFTTLGTFGAGTYFWEITAINAAGETIGSNEVTHAVVSTGRQTLNWTTVPGATGYKVYRGTVTGLENVLVATLGAVTTYIDTGDAGVAGTVPVTNTAVQGAYGTAQRPPETGTNTNQWWTVTTDVHVTLLHDPVTDAVVTWKGWQDGVTETPLILTVGISDPISGAGQESNSLAVRNVTGTHSYDIVGAANPTGAGDTVLPKAPAAIGQGIPIPRPNIWSASVEYGLSVYVQHRGAAWRSIGTSLGVEPTLGSIYWEKVGADNRPVLAYSFYAHGPLTGTGGTGGVAVAPGLAFFDEQGNLLIDQTTPTPISNFLFDTFNHTFGTPDYSTWGGTWSTTGVWDTEPVTGDDPVAYPVGLGTATVTVPGGLLGYRISTTFAKAAATGSTDALLLRYVDANNWMRVSRTKVEKLVSGTLTTVTTLSTAVQDNDRVTVKMNDTSNTFTVYINGSSVATGSLTGGSSPYKHGMMVL